jgi:2'-5' RNA ligase
MRTLSKKSEELFYLISPSKSVSDFVELIKTNVEATLGYPLENRFSKAHVSLMKDSQEHAESFLYDVESKMRSFRPFNISVKNLNVFWQGEQRRTIYLDIVYKTPICEIFESLTEKNISFTPHITIAKNLEVYDFLKVWKNLKKISYSNTFHCDHLTVLRKEGNKWSHHIDIPFAQQ